MDAIELADPALTVALALAAGLVAQALAQHLRMPGIVPLLAAGVVLGPDGLHLIRPGTLGPALPALVGYAVAVILFEGGMNLNIQRLRRESGTIRRLVTIGAIVTAGGAAVAARYIMGWSWEHAILFGTLVIVTGPTVISPIVRRVKLNRNLQTILEGEGVLIDPIGAIIAVVALEVALQPTAQSFLSGLLGIGLKLSIGVLLGLASGYVLALLLRPRYLIPEGMGNVFTLAFVLTLFHISNALQPESGIAAVTAAGLVVGNIRTRALRDLMEFKEGLTVMLIGMLFVLLAADVRLEEIARLGWPALITVLVLMFVVRPLNVLASTFSSSLNSRERTFLAWLAPRGIVAAAVASFFAQELARHGDPGGEMLRAMVFLVIAVTVNVQGLTGGLVAGLLGVRRRANAGYAILGANELARALGQILRDGGEEVIFLDSRADATHAAQEHGFRVVFGNALEERTRQRAELDAVAACIGMTQNEEVNLLFVRRAREEYKVPRSAVVLEGHITEEVIRHADAHILFGIRTDVDLWSLRLRRGTATIERYRRARRESPSWPDDIDIPANLKNAFVPITVQRNKKVTPVDETTRYNKSDELTLVVFKEKHDEAVQWLVTQGWGAVAQNAPTDRQ
jgi:NhaP-type Na+/H+ or K+/H+ antiporter